MPRKFQIGVFMCCIAARAIIAGWPKNSFRCLLTSALTRFLLGRLRWRDRERQSRVCAPTFLIEIATVTARGLAGQPMKCGRERARLAEADIEPNRGVGQLTIRQ
jgi:hypothetical protein